MKPPGIAVCWVDMGGGDMEVGVLVRGGSSDCSLGRHWDCSGSGSG